MVIRETTADQERAERILLREIDAAKVQFAVDTLAAGLDRLANGDLTHRISADFVESMDKLRVDFNMSVERLQTALVKVGTNAEAIAAGSSEIRASADDSRPAYRTAGCFRRRDRCGA